MGASDSKLVFKQGIFRLADIKSIPHGDAFWEIFWKLPQSSEDIFSLFSPADIRRVRDKSPGNLETLITELISKLIDLRRQKSISFSSPATELEALNCIRVLTRLLPFVYENESLESWEEKLFWEPRNEAVLRRSQTVDSEVIFERGETEEINKADTASTAPTTNKPSTKAVPTSRKQPELRRPLGEELIDNLIDLLFLPGFTLPSAANNKRGKVTYAIWHTGVGCNTPINTTKELENNRTEILRLLLTLASKSMYLTSGVLPVKGVKAITYMATKPDKQVVLSLLCSLLNTTLKYDAASWRVPYDYVVFKDQKQLLVTYSLRLLLVLIIYPIPESNDGAPRKNYFRHFLGRLHRSQDFEFIADGVNRMLKQPLQATTTYLPGSQKSMTCAPELIMLFWEIFQGNKRFRSFVVDSDRGIDFMVLIIFYAIDQKQNPSSQGFIRMCIFVLQSVSAEANFGKSLKKIFSDQDSLPSSIRIPDFLGTYADFLIISIHNLLTYGKGSLEAIYPALLAILNNVAPHIQGIGRISSSKLIHLFSTMSSASFLFANDANHFLLGSVLQAINSLVEHHYAENSSLVYAILKAADQFRALRELTLESGKDELRRILKRKEAKEDDENGKRSTSGARTGTSTPTSANITSSPRDFREHDAFAIGDDDEDDGQDSDAGQKMSRHDDSAATILESKGSPRYSISSADEAIPAQLKGMSEKARGKMPLNQPPFSRQNSTTSLGGPGLGSRFEPNAQWIETWLPELQLHTILTVIDELGLKFGQALSTGISSAMAVVQTTDLRSVEPSTIRLHLFEWSALSLGWYESLLWAHIFAGEMAASKGAAGVWTGTAIRLFRVREAATHGPSLLAPRGAVDAVGSNLVNRIGSISLRSSATSAAAAVGTTSAGGPRNIGDGIGATAAGNARPYSVREV